jgi:predicted small lipoprotein YifL
MLRLVAIALLLGSLSLAACGRRGDIEPPEGARADAPRVPQRGSPVLYPY